MPQPSLLCFWALSPVRLALDRVEAAGSARRRCSTLAVMALQTADGQRSCVLRGPLRCESAGPSSQISMPALKKAPRRLSSRLADFRSRGVSRGAFADVLALDRGEFFSLTCAVLSGRTVTAPYSDRKDTSCLSLPDDKGMAPADSGQISRKKGALEASTKPGGLG